MENNEKARLIARFCYKPKKTEEDFATQLFIEDLVLDSSVSSYTIDEITDKINKFLSSQ